MDKWNELREWLEEGILYIDKLIEDAPMSHRKDELEQKRNGMKLCKGKMDELDRLKSS